MPKKKTQKKIATQIHKSKAEVEFDFKKRLENARQRRLVIETLYPIITKYAKNIEHGKTIMGSFNMALGTAFSNRKHTWTLEEVVAFEKFDDTLADAVVYQELLAALKTEKLFDAESMMRELSNSIDAFERKERMERPFSSLQTDFIPVIDPKPDGKL